MPDPRGLPWARFDDLPNRSSVMLRATGGTLVADRPEDVLPVLSAVDDAVAAGRSAFGFVAYEAAPALDPALTTHPPVDGLPLAWFGVSDGPAPAPPPSGTGYRVGPWRWQWSRDEHARAVAAVRHRIADGETYQVNLTTRLVGPVTGDALALYAALSAAQRGSHNAYLDLGRFAIVSASPELFVERRADRLTMRPMKGTSRRGGTTDEDRLLAERLRTSPKERAENVMIVDLLRNDLARLAPADEVRVERLCAVETYPTVHQLTSEIVARTRGEVPLTDVFRALFPSGSVTGAPKAATMRIIRNLEAGPRGVYCGAVGLVTPAGARFSVPIRTLLVDRSSGTGTYGAGGGITWASRPDDEYDEVLAKARVLTALRPRTRG